MMKKFYLLLIISFLVFLSSCFDYTEVNGYYYASSLGIEYDLEKEQYNVYLYIINNLNLADIKTSSTEKDSIAYTATYSEKSIEKCLHVIFENSDIHIDLRHLRTVILHKSFVNSDNLRKFCNLIHNDINFYFNFAVYVTDDLISDIYKVNNFTETSAYMTLLTMTNNYDNYHLKYFPNLINDLDLKYLTYKYPLIKCKKEIFEKNDQEYITIFLSGYGCLNKDDELIIFNDELHHGVIYLNNRTNFQITLSTNNDITYNINKYKINYLLKKDEFHINIDLNGYIINKENNIDYDKLLETELKNLLTDLYKDALRSGIDIFNINHYCKYEKSDLSYQTANLKFNINIKLN